MPATCPYCRSPLSPTDPATTCASCGLTYHQECWRENGGCAAYGCRGGGRTASPGGDWEGPLEIDLSEADLSRESPGPAPRPRLIAPRPPRSLLRACCEVGSGLGALIGVIVGGLAGIGAGVLGFLGGAALGLLAGLLAGYLLVPLAIVALAAFLCLSGGLPPETAAAVGLVVGALATIILATIQVPGSPPG